MGAYHAQSGGGGSAACRIAKGWYIPSTVDGRQGMSGFRVSEFRVVADGLEYPEGPVYQSDGSILLVEIHKGTLTRVSADGTKQTVANLGGGPNGAAIGPDGA